MSMNQPEVWLRGPLDGFAPLLMPVAHSLFQVREEFQRLQGSVAESDVWLRPGGAASLGFHIRHTGGALDRLLTYARGEQLSAAQLAFLRAEGDAGNPVATLADTVAVALEAIERALDQIRRTPLETLLEPRRVGRAALPSTTLGLLFHAAEHSTRHSGQAITTARILEGERRRPGAES
jgi:hypothetical protein